MKLAFVALFLRLSEYMESVGTSKFLKVYVKLFT